MFVKDILEKQNPSFSFEFFPPKTAAGWEHLFNIISDLVPLKPAYASVTYGAGGSTRDHTHDLVVKIQQETEITVVSHLTCVGHSCDEIDGILDRYAQHGVENILALRGDPPAGDPDYDPSKDGFKYAAQLVEHIKKNYNMCVGVAGFPEGHPATPNRLKEIDYLKAKVDAGADYIVSQLFFDNRDFYDYCERCEISGINVPIIAGIMPITTRKGMLRTAEIAAGAKIPASLLRALNRAGNDKAIAKVGVHWATEQVRDLIDNHIRGIHFYTLNCSKEALGIYETLGVKDSEQLFG